jgi:hypothetical protein
MLRIANKARMLRVIVPNVVILSVVAPLVLAPYFTILEKHLKNFRAAQTRQR